MGKQSLHNACLEGNLKLVKALLEDIEVTGVGVDTPKHKKASNHPEIVSFLINSGANPESRTSYKMTPLHVAAFYGSADAAERMILRHGVNINASDFGAWTPLHYSCHYNRPAVSLLLLQHGAAVALRSAELQFVPLHLAARAGDLVTVKELVARSSNPSQRNSLYLTPLHLACQNNNVDVVRFLLEQGVPSDAPDEAGIMPAHLTKRPEIMELLEKYGGGLPHRVK